MPQDDAKARPVNKVVLAYSGGLATSGQVMAAPPSNVMNVRLFTQ
jgi:argininosuccinate synthase